MHGSVLQNKKYISFAEENTVEVLCLSRLDEGIQKKDRRAATFKGKDVDGTEKEFMVGWPNLTAEEISALNGSKGGSYNNTGRIPYTAVVNPHTLEEMGNIKGGFGMGALVDLVTEKKKELEKAHGKGLSRRTLAKVKEADADIHKELEAGELAKAMADVAALEKKTAKEPQAILDLTAKIKADVIEAATKKLDEIEAMIGREEKAEASKQLGPLARALKGTALETRANELLEKAK